MFLSKGKNFKGVTYRVRDKNCLGCACFIPGVRKVRYKTLVFRVYKSNFLETMYTCTTRYDRGCPEDTGYSEEIKQQMMKDGWKTRAI
jgi:hypothetical protein